MKNVLRSYTDNRTKSNHIGMKADMMTSPIYGYDFILCFVAHNNTVTFQVVLPPFAKDKTRRANIDFTKYFCQKAPFLDF